MAQYRLYRHPLHGVVAVRDGGLQSLLGQEPRLLRAGYSYSGSADGDSPQSALAQSVHGGIAPAAPSLTRRRNADKRAPVPPLANAHNGPVVGAVLSAVILIAAAIAFLSEHESSGEAAMPEPASAEFPLGAFGPWLDFSMITQQSGQIDAERYLMSGVEARVQDGEGQCRLRYAAVDPQHPVQWRWWCAQSDQDFARLNRKYTGEGYAIAQRHLYTDPDGWNWHSAVWYRESRR